MSRRTRVELKLNIDDLKLAVGKRLDEAMFEAGQVIAREVERRAPKDTGKLARSVYVATPERSTYTADAENEKERKPGEGEVVIAVANFRAHFVEAGTSKQPARPFFRPAFESSRDEATERAAQVLREGLA